MLIEFDMFKDLVNRTRNDSTHFVETKLAIWSNVYDIRIGFESSRIIFPMSSGSENGKGLLGEMMSEKRRERKGETGKKRNTKFQTFPVPV